MYFLGGMITGSMIDSAAQKWGQEFRTALYDHSRPEKNFISFAGGVVAEAQKIETIDSAFKWTAWIAIGIGTLCISVALFKMARN